MKATEQFFHMALFVLQHFIKWNLKSFLNFHDGLTFGSERITETYKQKIVVLRFPTSVQFSTRWRLTCKLSPREQQLDLFTDTAAILN